jgi:hypothetical protein
LSFDQQKFRFDNFLMEPKHKEMDVLLTFWPIVVRNCSSVFRGGSFVPRDISINFNQTGYCNVLLQRLVNQRRKEPVGGWQLHKSTTNLSATSLATRNDTTTDEHIILVSRSTYF